MARKSPCNTSCLSVTNHVGKKVWDLAEELWKMKVNKWPELKNIGNILACTMAVFQNPEGKRLAGTNRLYRIIITESAHLQQSES